MNPPTAVAAEALVLSRRPALGALATLFWMTIRQHVRGRRLLVVSLLFALPGVLAIVVRLASRVAPPTESLQFALIFNLIPCAMATLTALLYATGIIQDEVEEQTLTYLLLRPVPRWALYLVRLLATLSLTVAVMSAFTVGTFAVIALTAAEPTTLELLGQALTTAGVLSLAQLSYFGLFGLLGLLVRRSLLLGVGYIVLFEGLLAAFDTVARRLTVMYYFRVLLLRWLQPASGKEWSIDLATAPQAQTCVLVLLGVGLVLAAVAAFYFAAREFRMKTPEGN